jgi:hypothetical protein
MRAIVAGRVVIVILVIVALGSGGCGGSEKKTKAATTGASSPATFGADPGEQSAGPPGQTYVPTGTLVADNGFRPEKDGFGFENYTNQKGYKNLTPAQVQAIFGDQVCANGTGPSCELTPPAQQWTGAQNQGMDGGHCYGFSVASGNFYNGQLRVDDFGGPQASELPIDGNDALQEQIAQSFVYQGLDQVRAGEVKGSPNDVLDRLTEALKANNDSYTLGIYQVKDGQKTGGHAITPYAVEDKGGGKFAVLVYDNNYPKITRPVEFDRNANTWSYDASTNPNEPSEKYQGDAGTQTISFFPTNPGNARQPCPFCGLGTAGAGGSGLSSAGLGSAKAGARRYVEIFLEARPTDHAHLLITNERGQRYGYVGSRFVSEIPGVQTVRKFADRDWREQQEPEYRIPTGMKVKITIDASSLKAPDTENLVVVGPGYDAALDGVTLHPGQKDVLELAADDTALSYRTDPRHGESPTIQLGFNGRDGVDYAFAVKALAVQGGSRLRVADDPGAGTFQIDTRGTTNAGTYNVQLTREDKHDSQHFGHDALGLQAGETATLHYARFTHHGQGIPMTTRHGSRTSTQILSD